MKSLYQRALDYEWTLWRKLCKDGKALELGFVVVYESEHIDKAWLAGYRAAMRGRATAGRKK